MLVFDENQRYYNLGNGRYIHRIVAMLFIPNPENKPCVDHIDTNPHNNMWYNLRWCTQKENCNNELTREHLVEVCNTQAWKEKVSIGVSKALTGKKKNYKAGLNFRKNYPDGFNGEANPAYGRRWMHNQKDDQIYVKDEEIQYYLDKGYVFGILKYYLRKCR